MNSATSPVKKYMDRYQEKFETFYYLMLFKVALCTIFTAKDGM